MHYEAIWPDEYSLGGTTAGREQYRGREQEQILEKAWTREEGKRGEWKRRRQKRRRKERRHGNREEKKTAEKRRDERRQKARISIVCCDRKQ